MLFVLGYGEQRCASLKYETIVGDILAWSIHWCIHLILFSSAGGPWLITDMRRGETIFELDHSFQEKLEQGKDTMKHNLTRWMVNRILELPPHTVWVDNFKIQHLSSSFNQRVYLLFQQMG